LPCFGKQAKRSGHSPRGEIIATPAAASFRWQFMQHYCVLSSAFLGFPAQANGVAAASKPRRARRFFHRARSPILTSG
jgi:hypothetical protein